MEFPRYDEGMKRVDELVKQYLVFRGFISTQKALESEIKSDKSKNLRITKIVDTIFLYLRKFEYEKFLEFWVYLNSTFFAKHFKARSGRLGSGGRSHVHQLEVMLTKFYLVNCLMRGRTDECEKFFKKYGEQLSKQDEFKEWFVLPFLRNPEHHELLQPYYNEQWMEMLNVSLLNFISTVFQSIRKPKLVTMENDFLKEKKKMKKSITVEGEKNELLYKQIREMKQYIVKLEKLNNVPHKTFKEYNYQKIKNDKRNSETFKASGTINNTLYKKLPVKETTITTI